MQVSLDSSATEMIVFRNQGPFSGWLGHMRRCGSFLVRPTVGCVVDDFRFTGYYVGRRRFYG